MIALPLRFSRRHLRRTYSPTQVCPMTVRDVDEVFALWAAYASEQFGENLSYDRWGPGVPVPYDDEAAAHEAPTQLVDPSLAVRQHLDRLIDHPTAFALLAAEGEHPVGFLTASLRPISTSGESNDQEGKIDKLYVSPSRRRRGIGSLLVATAVAHLRERGASIFRAEFHPQLTEARRFWDRQPEWSHDARTYRIYD